MAVAKVLEHLELISRRRRSRGRQGRISDMVTLAVHREFSLTRAEILEAKQAVLRVRRQALADALQLANSASSNSQGLRTNKER